MIGYGSSYMFGGGMIWMLVLAAALIIPFWRILPRHGIPAWVSLAAIIPVLALVMLWIIAFKNDDTIVSDES